MTTRKNKVAMIASDDNIDHETVEMTWISFADKVIYFP